MKLTLKGKIHNGKLSLEKDRLTPYLKKEGCNLLMEITFFEDEGTPLQRAYFRKVVVPEFQKAFFEAGERYTLEKTEQNILSFCPDAIQERFNENTEKWEKFVRPLEDLSKTELTQVIETLKEIAAKHFNHIIA